MRVPPKPQAPKDDSYEAFKATMRSVASRERPLPPALRERLAGKPRTR